MAGMVRHIIHPFLVLLCCIVIVKCREHCLEWYINQDKLNFKCRVPGFSHSISLIDSQGKLYTNCSFDRGTHTCTPLVRKDFVAEPHYAYNFIIFTIPKLNKNMDGLWVCVQNNLTLTTRVSLLRGIIVSTEVSIAGQFNNDIHNPETKLACFSCREPDGHNVEFLENSRSVDSLTFIQNTRKCTHYKGECHDDECNCTETEFVRTFQYNVKNNRTTYACDMLFTDPFTHEKFSKLASVSFNGKEFYDLKTSASIKKAGDKIWKETFITSRQKESNTGLEPARMKPVTVTVMENISVGKTGGLNTFQMIVIVVGCVVVLMFVLILVHQRYNYIHKYLRKTKTTELIQIEESVQLISKPPCSLSTGKELAKIEVERESDQFIDNQPCSLSTEKELANIEDERECDQFIDQQSSSLSTEKESAQIGEERESDQFIDQQSSSLSTKKELANIEDEREFDQFIDNQPCSLSTEKESAQIGEERESDQFIDKQSSSLSTEKEFANIEDERESDQFIDQQSSSLSTEKESAQVGVERESDQFIDQQSSSLSTEKESAQIGEERESDQNIDKQSSSLSPEKEIANNEDERESDQFIDKQHCSSSTEKESAQIGEEGESDQFIDKQSSSLSTEKESSNRNDYQKLITGTQYSALEIKEGSEYQSSGSVNQILEYMKKIDQRLESVQSDLRRLEKQMDLSSENYMDMLSFKNKLHVYLKNRFSESPWLNVQQDTKFMNEVNRYLNAEGLRDDSTAYRHVITWSSTTFSGFRNTLRQKIEQEMKNRDLSSIAIKEFSSCIMFGYNMHEENPETTERLNLCRLLRSYLYDEKSFPLYNNRPELPQDFWEEFRTYFDSFMQNKKTDKWHTLTANDNSRGRRCNNV